MPSKSEKQARMMAGAAHDPAFAKKMGVPQKVAKEFNRADAASGMMSKAMKKKHRKMEDKPMPKGMGKRGMNDWD